MDRKAELEYLLNQDSTMLESIVERRKRVREDLDVVAAREQRLTVCVDGLTRRISTWQQELEQMNEPSTPAASPLKLHIEPEGQSAALLDPHLAEETSIPVAI